MDKHVVVLLGMALLGVACGCSPGARVSDRQVEVTSESPLKDALTKFRIDLRRYPTTAEGLRALLERPAQDGDGWHGPYVDAAAVVDKWGSEYRYRFPGVRNPNGYDLWSLGPDKVESADDIRN